MVGGGEGPHQGSGKPPPTVTHPHLMRHIAPGRSTEEIIALFISITFMLDAVKGTVKSGYLARVANCVPLLAVREPESVGLQAVAGVVK